MSDKNSKSTENYDPEIKSKSAAKKTEPVKAKTSAKTSSKSGAKNAKNAKKGGIVKWFKELKSELKKVVWPSREKVVNNTAVVLSGMILIGAIIYGFDTGLRALMAQIIGYATGHPIVTG